MTTEPSRIRLRWRKPLPRLANWVFEPSDGLGCLIDFSYAEADGICNPLTDLAVVERPCRIGQDQPIDCRLCSATNPHCRAP